MGAVAVTAPSTASCLPIGSQRREGRIVTDSNDDVENEAWSLVGRAVAHTLLKRAVALSGAGVNDVVTADTGSVVGQSSCLPSSLVNRIRP